MVYIDDEQTQKLNTRFIGKAMDFPMLSKKEETDLLIKWVKGKDKEALKRVINAHLKLAVSTALKFRNYNLPLGDLTQEACIGLLVAAQKFDLKKDVRFSTYAQWWIRSAIQDYILKNWSVVRTGTTAKQKRLYFALKSAKASLSQYLRSDGLLNREGRIKLAKKFDVKPDDIAFMDNRLAHYDHSLNAPVSDSSGFIEIWQNMIVDKGDHPNLKAQEKQDHKKIHRWIQQALQKLDGRAQLIISKRWLTDQKTTLKNIAKQLNLSQERVRQIEKQSLHVLKEEIQNHISQTSDVL